MNIPTALNRFFEDRFGSDILEVSAVGGGCINEAWRVELNNHQLFFVKQNSISLKDMFEKEAMGLELLANATRDIVIPETYGVVEDDERGQVFLVMSFVVEGRRTSGFDEFFGASLALMHRNTSEQFGLDHDNFIGRLPQNNSWRDDWVTFFIECRIEPQFAMACNNGYFTRSEKESLNRMYQRLPDLFPAGEPALLHGDLWGGNYLCSNENRPVLIDPAVYYGHREAELSFTRLFGGFGSAFYDGYDQTFPLEPGFSKRTGIYNLYPLLVHVNLFGGSYISQAASIIRDF